MGFGGSGPSNFERVQAGWSGMAMGGSGIGTYNVGGPGSGMGNSGFGLGNLLSAAGHTGLGSVSGFKSGEGMGTGSVGSVSFGGTVGGYGGIFSPFQSLSHQMKAGSSWPTGGGASLPISGMSRSSPTYASCDQSSVFILISSSSESMSSLLRSIILENPTAGESSSSIPCMTSDAADLS